MSITKHDLLKSVQKVIFEHYDYVAEDEKAKLREKPNNLHKHIGIFLEHLEMLYSNDLPFELSIAKIRNEAKLEIIKEIRKELEEMKKT